MVIRNGVQICEKREHFGCMASAAEDDEKMRGAAALAGERAAGVCGGEDVEESELGEG